MLVLADTGVLLRFVHRRMPLHLEARTAIRRIREAGHSIVSTTQNVSEYWNVSTRPKTARGGLGLNASEAGRGLQIIERFTTILAESPLAYPRWKQLLAKYGVQGVQVHDARIVANMISYGVTHLTSFNTTDFLRYSEVTAVDPVTLAAVWP